MAKDPAVLLYTSDFLTGTMMMSDEQVGKYMRLLCLQHQKGKLSENDMMKICRTYDEDVFSKFKKTPEGFYLNERMMRETDKRRAYSESRSNNRRKKEESKDMNNISKSYDNHMENENENINDNKNSKRKRGTGGKGKEEKINVREHVSLKHSEVEALKRDHGEQGYDWIVDKLDNYKGSTGKKYANDYKAIGNWVLNAYSEHKGKTPNGKSKHQQRNEDYEQLADNLANVITGALPGE